MRIAFLQKKKKRGFSLIFLEIFFGDVLWRGSVADVDGEGEGDRIPLSVSVRLNRPRSRTPSFTSVSAERGNDIGATVQRLFLLKGF